MRPLKPGEIYLLAQTLHHLEGARLQGIHSSKKDLILEFWLKGDLYFLWYEDATLRPYLSFWPDQLPMKIKKAQLPLGLFLKANFLGKSLKTVSFHPEYGRMLRLYFDKDLSIEFRLFPHGQNIIASTNDKSLSLHKPKALQPVSILMGDNEALRSVEEFSMEWLQFQLRPTTKSRNSQGKVGVSEDEKAFEKKKKKLKKAIDQVAAELTKKETSLWGEVGEWLKTHQSFKNLPMEYLPFVDQKKSLHWNVNHSFQKAKDVRKKTAGTEERLRILKNELEALERGGVLALSRSPSKTIERVKLKDPVKARSFQVAGDLRVMAGKSAQDNINLLRQAKPWDLWFHLKDWPSSHAIVFRPKKRELTQKEEFEIIQWFFKQNFGQKWEQEKGNKYEVIIAECRFVKPIRGDRSGRVNYHNERVQRVQVKD